MKSVIFLWLVILVAPNYTSDNHKIQGNWKVINAELSNQVTLEPEASRQFEPFLAAFENSVFEFKKNGKSTLKTRIPQFQYEDHLWSLTSDESYIEIRETRDSAPKLVIAIAEIEDKYLFYLMDSPFVLTVEKL